MSPSEKDLINQADIQLKNLAHLIAGTPVSTSKAFEELTHLLYELKISASK